MTEKLYESDSHLFEFTAKVISVEKCDDYYLTVLDRTAFFPATENAVRLVSVELNLKQMRRVRIYGYPLEIAFLFGNGAEVALGKPHNGFEIDRTHRADGNLIGVVGAADKSQNISVVVVGNRFGSAQNVAPDGVSAENQVLKIVEDKVARRVLVRIYLIHNHFLLFLAFVVGEG